jgi:hypothetical protein
VEPAEVVVVLPLLELVEAPAMGAMTLTSIWTWWPGRCPAGAGWTRRLRIRHTPDGDMATSW